MKFSHRFLAAALGLALFGSACFQPLDADAAKKKKGPTAAEIEIGRASCRERV